MLMYKKNEIGRIGQQRWDGMFSEEFLPELRGIKGIKAYKEMANNDDIVGAMLFAIRMLIRQADWFVEPGGSSKGDKEAAEFVEQCMDDMQNTWTDTISEVLSFLVYGWSFHEIVYKRRNGRKKDKTLSSKYNDGLIGWQKLPIRAQDTLYRWEYDDRDNLIGMTQQPPPDFALLTIPMRKALLFRTESAKDNPEGRSVLRNAYRCFDEETEILTINGWKKGTEVTIHDKVATLNPQTNALEYERPSEIHRYQHDGDMIHFTSRFLDILVTGNHRMWIRRDYSNRFEFVEAADARISHRVMRFAEWNGIERSTYTIPKWESVYENKGTECRQLYYNDAVIEMDAWLAFLGLFLSEGDACCSNHRRIVGITQNEKRAAQIRNILDRLPWHYYERRNKDRNCIHFEFCNAQLYEELKVFGKAKDKYVPDYVKELSPRQIQIFLDAYLFGDGAIAGAAANGYDGTPVLGTISKKLADDLQELGLKAGYECQINTDMQRKTALGENPYYIVSLGKRRLHKLKNKRTEKYSGMVWCPTTKNGIVYVRRNGKPAWVGNCWYFKRRMQEIEAIGIERDLAGLPVIYGPEGLDLWDPDDDDAKRIYAALTTMIKNIRRNEFEGLVMPNGYKVELLSTGGSRQFDTNAIINRYNVAIAQTVMADFLMLGHEGTGSYALSEDKSQLFMEAIGTYLDIICEVFNNQGIPALIDVNGDHFNGITDYPSLRHGNVAHEDIEKVSAYLKDMIGIGLIIPDEELEDYARTVANLPERTYIPDERKPDPVREQQRRAPEKTARDDNPEWNDEEEENPEEIEEARKRLGR